MNTERIVRIDGDVITVGYDDGTAVVIGDTTAGQTSDTYHSIDDLYRHRMLLTAALLNGWWERDRATISKGFNVHKSWRHADAEDPMFPGMFKVGATLPTGQISYHYPAADWSLFDVRVQYEFDPWDGHTAEQAADRLEAFLRGGF